MTTEQKDNYPTPTNNQERKYALKIPTFKPTFYPNPVQITILSISPL